MMSRRQHETEAGLRALRDDLDALSGGGGVEGEGLPAECGAAQFSLDQYVTDELVGGDLASLYPALWQHLQTCEECQLQHTLLMDMLRAEQRGELAELPHEGPATIRTDQDVEAQWNVVYEAADAGFGSGVARPGLLFVFAPAYLQQRLVGGPLQRMGVGERQSAYGGRSLILDSIELTPEGEVSLRVFMETDPDTADGCNLFVEALGDVQPRGVRLTLGAQTWEAPLDGEGQAWLGPVPVGSLSEVSFVRPTLRLIL